MDKDGTIILFETRILQEKGGFLMKRRIVCVALLLVLCLSFLPEARAMATLDSYFNANFGRSYDVFSGPGRNYYRANMGKAMYGGGAARVYGMEGDWIMMGYQTSGGDYRIGYVHKDALSTAKYVDGTILPLNFDHYVAYADDYCRITDDPIINNKMICTLPENTAVTVLATMGTSWTYIEANTSQGLMRGFVWSMHLKNSNAPVTPSPTMVPLPTMPPQPTMIPWPTMAPVTAAPWITAVPFITAIPWNQPTAQPHVTAAPPANSAEWLPTAKTLYLAGNWPVYSGPSEYYYRANNGKATKGEGTCQVYGIENMGYGNWLMIGYAMTAGGYRVGYIRAEALGERIAETPILNLAYKTRRLKLNATMTDDPLHTASAVASIPAGTYVLFLGYTYSSDAVWAYVEALSGNQIMRGFVLAGALEEELPY